MENLKIDEKYNILEEKGLYEDEFIDTVEAIHKAETKKKISKPEASLLLNILLRKELKKETKAIFPVNKQKEFGSLFMNLKTNKIKHVQ